MVDYLPFVKCFCPVKVYDRTGVPSLVPCGKCQACEVQKHTHLSQLLQVEESRSKHCAFITLTYDEEYLPIADFSSVFTCDAGEQFTPEVSNLRILQDIEKGFYTVPSLFWSSRLVPQLDRYNLRRDLYKSKYSYNKNLTYEHDKVAFLYPRDLQLFVKRLRKYIKDNYDEKVRFYAIGEYGTNSLRPHWHILLFYSSDDLFRDFEDVVDLGTSSRPCETALFLCDLWEYGITSSANTDGKAYYYVSSYVTKSADFPPFLADFSPQKAYHSVFLGQVFQEEDTARMLRDREFEHIGETSVVSSDGSEHVVSVSRSLLSRLLPRYTQLSFADDEVLREQLFAYLKTRKYARSVLEQAAFLYECYLNDDYPTMEVHRLCCVLKTNLELVGHADKISLLSAVTSVLYASKRFLHSADMLGIDYDEYFQIYKDYDKWLRLNTLRTTYEQLECNDVFAEMYYYGVGSLEIDTNDGVLYSLSVNPNNCQDFVAFKSFKTRFVERHYKSVKHRIQSDRYKFLQQ